MLRCCCGVGVMLRSGRLCFGPTAPASKRAFKIKDRSWFPNAVAGKPNLAIFIDADSLTPNSAQEAIARIPTSHVCLRRLFTIEETAEWTAFRSSRKWSKFQVDSFMPVHIQLLADVSHVMDHRNQNGATRVALVVPDHHGEAYLRAFPETADNGGWNWTVVTPERVAGSGTVQPR
jgi:hypothetical protein